MKTIRFLQGLCILAGLVTLLTGCGGGDSSSSSAINHPPTANAGANQSVLVNTEVALDGSTSKDPDGDTLTYSWRMVSKPSTSTTSLVNPSTVKPKLVVDQAGDYVLGLIVRDGKLSSTTDTVIIKATANPTNNHAPRAQAGADKTANLGQTIQLDGSASSDVDGDTLTYQWTLTRKPTTSSTSLTNANQAKGRFIPDVVGSYELKLTVSDDHLTASDSIIITVVKANTGAPIAKGSDKYVMLGNTVTLDASASSDPDNDSLTYHWVLKSAPTGSTASLSSVSAIKPTLKPDQVGDYLFDLTVADGTFTSQTVTVKVSSQAVINSLAYQVLDAEYSKALDKIIMVSSNPNRLHIYDAATHTEQTIILPLTPTSVSVGPDGWWAAVGYDAYVSYVDLKNAKLIKSIPVATNVLDLVLAANGYIYAFPKRDQWEKIYSITISTGEVATGAGYQIYAGTLAKLHPNGTSIYGANNGLSPDDIEKYDIQTGVANKLYDSPYHGDYPMCGNLWFSEEGKRIFTACGNVFRTSDVQAQDMLYNGSLVELTHVKDLVHSAAKGKVAAIPADVQTANQAEQVDTKVLTYDDEFLTPSDTVNLPYFAVNEQGFMGHGKFVFFNKAADTLIVILKADTTATMLNDYGVFTLKQ